MGNEFSSTLTRTSSLASDRYRVSGEAMFNFIARARIGQRLGAIVIVAIMGLALFAIFNSELQHRQVLATHHAQARMAVEAAIAVANDYQCYGTHGGGESGIG